MAILLLIMVSGFTVAVFSLVMALNQTRIELSRTRSRLFRYNSLASKEDFEQQLNSNIELKQTELDTLDECKEALNTQIVNLQQKLRESEAKAFLQSVDAYDPHYDFLDSSEYTLHLANIQSQQESMRRNGLAYFCTTEWSVRRNEHESDEQAKREGEKLVKNLLELIRIIFESQCKYSLQKVKYNNVRNLEREITKTFSKINKLSTTTHCEISADYLGLKLRELHLRYEYKEKKHEEDEIKNAINKQLKEQEKERKSIEDARQEIEEIESQEKRFKKEIEEVRREMSESYGLHLEELEKRNQELEKQINKVRIAKEKATARFNMVKEGYIYVISNVGSFEENGSLEPSIYRICMTKSGKPDEYIKNMNPSVPFPFDIHYKVLSVDALDTIAKLHQRFQDRRVNIVNERREFFQVSLDEIKQAIDEIEKETGNLPYSPEIAERAPQAYEYRRTCIERKKRQNPPSTFRDFQGDKMA